MSTLANTLGQGISFPPRVGTDGRIAWSAGEDNIRESIRVILMTNAPERLRSPTFGASLGKLLFEPNTTPTHRLIRDRVETSLTRWEPRIRVQKVDVQPDPADPSAAILTIEYQLVATRAAQRLTFTLNLAA